MKALLLFWYHLVLKGFHFLFFQPISPSKQTQKLIVWRDAHLGDGLLSLPALYRIRQNFPSSYIILLSHNDGIKGIHFKDYLKEGIVDEIWDRSSWTLLQTIRKLRESKAHSLLAIMPYSSSLKWSIFSMIMVKLAGIKHSGGWKKESSFLAKRFLNKTSFSSEMERIEILLSELNLKKFEQPIIDQLIKQCTPVPSIPKTPYLIISPFTKGIANFWLAKNWVDLGIEIQKNTRFGLIVVGGERDRFEANQMISKWENGKFISVSIPELVQWIKCSNGVIGADSGTIHLANLLKKKNIALFGNSDYRGKWAHPENPGQLILYPRIDCFKCKGQRNKECTCMNHLPLEDVLKAMDSYF